MKAADTTKQREGRVPDRIVRGMSPCTSLYIRVHKHTLETRKRRSERFISVKPFAAEGMAVNIVLAEQWRAMTLKSMKDGCK
eukprot:4398632-Pleurochrysis_carterae.AAC.2